MGRFAAGQHALDYLGRSVRLRYHLGVMDHRALCMGRGVFWHSTAEGMRLATFRQFAGRAPPAKCYLIRPTRYLSMWSMLRVKPDQRLAGDTDACPGNMDDMISHMVAYATRHEGGKYKLTDTVWALKFSKERTGDRSIHISKLVSLLEKRALGDWAQTAPVHERKLFLLRDYLRVEEVSGNVSLGRWTGMADVAIAAGFVGVVLLDNMRAHPLLRISWRPVDFAVFGVVCGVPCLPALKDRLDMVLKAPLKRNTEDVNAFTEQESAESAIVLELLLRGDPQRVSQDLVYKYLRGEEDVEADVYRTCSEVAQALAAEAGQWIDLV